MLLILIVFQAACSFPFLVKEQHLEEPTSTPLSSPTEKLTITPAIPTPTQTVASTQIPIITETPEIQQVLEIKAEQSEVSVDNPKYNIIRSKPVLSGVESLERDFNLKLDAMYQAQVDEFISMVVENEPWRTQNIPDIPSWLDLRYEMFYLSEELISLSIPVEIYIAGMAHPNHFTLVVNYDLDKSRTLSLADVFESEGQILPVLSAYCKEELTKSEQLMFEEGILPEAVNYSNWVVNEQGLVVIFDPYKVAPYAMGTITVLIPWEVLSNEINPGSQLVRFQLH
jgi:hypothetical protein